MRQNTGVGVLHRADDAFGLFGFGERKLLMHADDGVIEGSEHLVGIVE